MAETRAMDYTEDQGGMNSAEQFMQILSGQGSDAAPIVLAVAGQGMPGGPRITVATDKDLRTAGADTTFYLLQPVSPSDAAAAMQAKQPSRGERDRMIHAICMRAGVPMHVQGFRYICTAISLALDTPEILGKITSELYPGIAHACHTSPSKVERSIRHAIFIIWERGHVEDVNRLFGFAVCKPETRMTNGEFIALLTSRCRMEDSQA